MHRHRLLRQLLLGLGFSIVAGPLTLEARSAVDTKDQDVKRPALSLKATPVISFSPARIFLTGELKGGPDDFQEFYCPTVEWDWGDGTRSETSNDCDPYEPGKSEIKRRFVVEHLYRMPGNYRIQLRLKKKDKVLTAANATVQVRPGFRDPGF